MKVLVVVFGGVDLNYLDQFGSPNLKQRQYGKVTVDELWNDRDVATQITSQLITGKSWRESGVTGRKKFTNETTEWIEKKVIRSKFGSLPILGSLESKTRLVRKGLYEYFGPLQFRKRNYVGDDLTCDTLFDIVDDSKAVYVPAYNPEPAWAIRRNILNPRQYPAFGEEGAVDLAEKNFAWRQQKLFAETDANYQLLVAQFQILDSLQHLYLVYSDEEQIDEVQAIYERMDEFAGEILDTFDQYDRVLFLSDNGAAHTNPGRTHHNRPFYSISDDVELDGTNMRDFFDHILDWVTTDPNPGSLSR